MKNDAILNLFNRLSTGLLKMVLFGLVARYIGVEDFGKFVLIISITTVLAQILNFGIEYSILTNENTFTLQQLYSFTIFKSLFIFFLFLLIGLILFSPFESLVIALCISTQVLFFILQTIYLKYDIYRYFIIINLVINILPIVGVFILKPQNEIYAILISSIVKLFLLFDINKYLKVEIIYYLKKFTKLYNNSFKYIIFEQSKFIHHRFDLILLSALGQNKTVGFISAIKNFVEFTQYLPKTIQVLIYKYSKNAYKIMKYSYLLITVLFVLIIITLSIYGQSILELIFGRAFIGINNELMISMIGSYFYCLSYINMSIIINTKFKYNQLNIIIVMLFLINYNFLCINFGYLGAIYAFLISSIEYFVITLLCIVILYKRRRNNETIT